MVVPSFRAQALLLAALLVSFTPLSPTRAQSTENVLRVGNGSEINSLDPAVQDVARLTVKMNTYDPLYRWLGNPPQMVPCLATSYTESPDGLTYTVSLAHGARFHYGTEVTADDVVYSMERLLALKQGSARFFLPLVAPGTTKAMDKYTVQFTLKQPAAPFAGLLAELYVVNATLAKAHEQNGDWSTAWLSSHEAGSGPYHVTQYDPAVGWYAERFKDYVLGWPANAPDGLRFRTIRETNSQTMALMRGDIDFFLGSISTDQFDKLAKMPNLVVMQEPHQRLFLINFNNKKPPFTDIHVRRAFSYAFDYAGLIHGLEQDKITRDPVPMPPGVIGYPKDATGFTYDLAKAKAELAQAEVPVDKPVTIYAMTGFPMPEQAAEILQAGLRKLGVTANIVAETWPTLADKCRNPDTAPDIMPIWASANYADPHTWAGEMYDSTRWGSYATCSYYKNPEVDTLLHKAFASQEPSERAELYEQANRIIMNDAPSIFVSNEIWINVRNKRVQGYEFTPVGNGNYLKPIWLQH
ncbi:MAG TPA: ABC transporter substrate-binding protein [Rhodopila sp.]